MSLPLIEAPKYSTILPVSNTKVTYRPFLVKEQKQLLVAVNGDQDQQLMAVEDIIKVCTFDKINPKKLSAADAEYLFIQIRSKSIGEKVDLTLTCAECQQSQPGDLDLANVEVQTIENHEKKITLDSGVILLMKDPNMETMDIVRRDNTPDTVIELIARCIESIWQGDEMFSANDYTLAELIEFVEQLMPSDLDKLQVFFESLPVLKHDIEFECKHCGAKNVATLEGLASFFV